MLHFPRKLFEHFKQWQRCRVKCFSKSVYCSTRRQSRWFRKRHNWTSTPDCCLEQIQKGILKSMKKYLSNKMSFQIAQNNVMVTVTLQILSTVPSEKVFSVFYVALDYKYRPFNQTLSEKKLVQEKLQLIVWAFEVLER